MAELLSCIDYSEEILEMLGNSTQADKVAEALHDGYQLSDKDIKQLETPDEEFRLMTWEVLGNIIRKLSLSSLTTPLLTAGPRGKPPRGP